MTTPINPPHVMWPVGNPIGLSCSRKKSCGRNLVIFPKYSSPAKHSAIVHKSKVLYVEASHRRRHDGEVAVSGCGEIMRRHPNLFPQSAAVPKCLDTRVLGLWKSIARMQPGDSTNIQSRCKAQLSTFTCSILWIHARIWTVDKIQNTITI
jgi:hypothetical protein